jgi:hypothetical protein
MAIFGILGAGIFAAGIFGTGAFGIAGNLGAFGTAAMDGAGSAGGSAELAGVISSASAGSAAGPAFFKEMICVYALGPLGIGGGAGVGLLTGDENAPVAPSEGRVDGPTTGDRGIGGFGDGGVGKTCGVAKTWGAGKICGAGKIGGVGALVLEFRDEISALKKPVNPVPAASFPATPEAGGDCSCAGFTAPNIAVKSPTVFRGGSIFWEESAGISDGASPWNGPWKTLVNSPGLGLSMTGGVIASVGKFLVERLGRIGFTGALAAGSVLGGSDGRGLTGSQSGAAGTGAV